MVGLDPECEGCQAMAQEAGAMFPPRFGQFPLDDQ